MAPVILTRGNGVRADGAVMTLGPISPLRGARDLNEFLLPPRGEKVAEGRMRGCVIRSGSG